MEKILKEAYQLGAKLFIISGGQPTLYPRLPELIEIGRSYGWIVKLNSNGSMITPEYAETLIKAGLNFITISLYTPDLDINAQMRGTNQFRSKIPKEHSTSCLLEIYVNILAGRTLRRNLGG